MHHQAVYRAKNARTIALASVRFFLTREAVEEQLPRGVTLKFAAVVCEQNIPSESR
jgi:hypothetical protein